jgi:hypothetical protein
MQICPVLRFDSKVFKKTGWFFRFGTVFSVGMPQVHPMGILEAAHMVAEN